MVLAIPTTIPHYQFKTHQIHLGHDSIHLFTTQYQGLSYTILMSFPASNRSIILCDKGVSTHVLNFINIRFPVSSFRNGISVIRSINPIFNALNASNICCFFIFISTLGIHSVKSVFLCCIQSFGCHLVLTPPVKINFCCLQ